jgi:hypothetical protein
MELFEEVFDKSTIYDMLFFNIKAVLIYPQLTDLKSENPALFERWQYLADTKYKANVVDAKYGQTIYEDNAVYYPEFTRIVAITYASVRFENNSLKRYLKKIVNEDEYTVIATFMDILHGLSSEAVQSSPPYFPILCGHNITNYDIPLLIKRYVLHRERFEINKQLPLLLKKILTAKPWEGKVVDTVNVWKFNGSDYTPLMLIADYLGLKKTVDVETLPDVSKLYWKTVNEGKPADAIETVSLQSATQTNLVIQLINELRQL